MNGRGIQTKGVMVPHKLVLILSLLATALVVSCKPSAEETTERELDKMKKETKEAARAINDYAYAQKAEFVETMQTRLAELDRDLDQLSDKVERSSGAAKAEAEIKLQALRERAARLKPRLDEAKNATESTWDDVKAGFKEGYSELEEGFKQARQWVSEKIAP